MKILKNSKIILVLILLFASYLRLYHLNSLPPSLYSDEVDAAYQALVFNQNHSDYYGNKFPINFHSFADWRSSTYIYFVSFFQKITNNSDLAVRLPSVFFSLLSIYFMYLLTGSLLAAFLLAICPWSIHYGRTGFEAVSGMIAAILAGLYFWKKYTEKSLFKYLLLSIFFFAFTTYCYSTARLFLIFIGLIISTVYFSFIKKMNLRHIVYAIVFSILLMSPLLVDTIKGHAGFRFSYISIFSEPQLSKNTDYLRYRDIFTSHQNETGVSTSFSSKIFHNKYSLISNKFLSNYFSSFSTDFLFINGDQNSRHGFGTYALIYYLDFFFIIIGLLYTLKKNRQNKLSIVFILMLLFAPIPFALTRDSLGPHATRLILMLPSLIYFSFQGIVYIRSIFKWTFPLIIILYLMSLFNFWHYYNFDYPQESAMSWHSGMKEAVISAKKYQLTTYFSNDYEPFLPFFLYYQPYLPTHTPVDDVTHFSNDFFDGSTINNNYYFGHLNWSALNLVKNKSIFIIPGTSQSLVPKDLKLLEKINKKYINSQDFYIYTNEN